MVKQRHFIRFDELIVKRLEFRGIEGANEIWFHQLAPVSPPSGGRQNPAVEIIEDFVHASTWKLYTTYFGAIFSLYLYSESVNEITVIWQLLAYPMIANFVLSSAFQ